MNKWLVIALLTVVGSTWSVYQLLKPPPSAAQSKTADPLGATLHRNKQLWASRKAQNYQYDLAVDCFCAMNAMGSVRIVVRNSETKSVQAVGRSPDSGVTFDPKAFGHYNSVDQIFRAIEDAIKHQYRRIKVAYHPTLGYPIKMILEPGAPDSERELNLTNFKILTE